MRDAFHLPKNIHTLVNLRSCKMRKIPSLVDFHSIYQFLHSQVYYNGLELRLLALKFVLTNKGESNRKLKKIFAGKNLKKMTQKNWSENNQDFKVLN